VDNWKKGHQKFIASSNFTQNPLEKKHALSAAPDSWAVSRLKKNMTIGEMDGVVKRDETDNFQVTSEIEKKMEETGIEGEEKFVSAEEEEDESLWEDEEDYFQELEERNALLEEALRERIENPFPPVYNQINKLCDAIEQGEKTLKPVSFYIQELENYVAKKLKTFSSLPEVDNDAITRSNQLMMDGLNLLIEVCNGIKRYTEDNSPYHMTLARQLLKQANEFFSEGKGLLLSVKLE